MLAAKYAKPRQTAELRELKLGSERTVTMEFRWPVPTIIIQGIRANVNATTTYRTVLARDNSSCFRQNCSWLVASVTTVVSCALAVLNRFPKVIKQSQLVLDFLPTGAWFRLFLSEGFVGTQDESLWRISAKRGRCFTEAYKATFKIQIPSNAMPRTTRYTT